MDNKQTIRIAQTKGFIIPKRCRKERFEILEGQGSTNEEALKNLKENYQKIKQEVKDYRFSNQVVVYDAIIRKYSEYTSIMKPLFPEASENNVIFFELDKI